MCQRNMSIFNSNESRSGLRFAFRHGMCIACWLLVIEILLQIVVRLPESISKHPRRFFSYGATVETKLRQKFAQGEISKRSILRAGWISPVIRESHREQYDVAFYGMSFTNQIADVMREVRSDLNILSIAGPGTPLSHSFECHAMGSAEANPKHAIIGVTGVWKLVSMTSDSLGNAGVQPCTFPRFKLKDGELLKFSPALNSFEELENALQQSTTWNQHIQLLAQHDYFYNPLLYNANVLEKSILGRITLHGFREQRSNRLRSQIHNARGFTNHPVTRECAAIARRLLVEFQANARRRGQHAIVLLLHKKGYDDHLYRLLGATLEEHQIDFVSTHSIFSSNEPSNFGSDHFHFTKENNLAIADEILRLIRENESRTAKNRCELERFIAGSDSFQRL